MCDLHCPAGAGHYVKMVHNGIEYGDMQLIAESYDLMQRLLVSAQLRCNQFLLNGKRRARQLPH
jgi:6-phosphogluconate dehydrogenase